MNDVAADSIDLGKYAGWFGWARKSLDRELEATHAAAEAAYRAEAGGASDEQAREAGVAAGKEPAFVDARTMALAEWAAWASSSAGFSPPDSLVVATQALAAVEADHDLDRTMDDVLAARGASRVSAKVSRRVWIAGALVLGLLVAGGATVGLINAVGPNAGKPGDQSAPNGPAGVAIKMTPNGDANVYAYGLPSRRMVFVFVDDVLQGAYQSDSTGAVSALARIPLGGHRVAVCLDDQMLTCPASTFVSRAQ